MLRIICREVNAGAACNVGGPVDTTYKTFDVMMPEVQEWLVHQERYISREVVGVEVVAGSKPLVMGSLVEEPPASVQCKECGSVCKIGDGHLVHCPRPRVR